MSNKTSPMNPKDEKITIDEWSNTHLPNSKQSQKTHELTSKTTTQNNYTRSQDIETIYGAFATLGFGHAPELRIQEIPVNKMIPVANNTRYLELNSEYPVFKTLKSDWFPVSRMNLVLRTGEKSFAFYSEDFERCEKWLYNFKRHLTDYHKTRCTDMENLEILFIPQQNAPTMR